MRILRSANPFVVFSLALLIASGCNAFEFMYGGESDEPEVLLEDARLALQSGDAEKAIDLLEKALEQAPENPEIRIELSSALFQANEVDLLVMKDLASFISDSPASASKTQNASGLNACNFTDEIDTTTRIDFSTDEAYQLLLGNVDVLQRVVDLLADALEIESTTELTENARSNAHLMRAISNMALSVIEIKLQADAVQASIHRLSNGSIGYCASSEAALDQLEAFIVCEKLPVIDEAVNDLINRQALFSSSDSELVSAVTSARDDIMRAITYRCATKQ